MSLVAKANDVKPVPLEMSREERLTNLESKLIEFSRLAEQAFSMIEHIRREMQEIVKGGNERHETGLSNSHQTAGHQLQSTGMTKTELSIPQCTATQPDEAETELMIFEQRALVQRTLQQRIPAQQNNKIREFTSKTGSSVVPQAKPMKNMASPKIKEKTCSRVPTHVQPVFTAGGEGGSATTEKTNLQSSERQQQPPRIKPSEMQVESFSKTKLQSPRQASPPRARPTEVSNSVTTSTDQKTSCRHPPQARPSEAAKIQMDVQSKTGTPAPTPRQIGPHEADEMKLERKTGCPALPRANSTKIASLVEIREQAGTQSPPEAKSKTDFKRKTDTRPNARPHRHLKESMPALDRGVMYSVTGGKVGKIRTTSGEREVKKSITPMPKEIDLTKSEEGDGAGQGKSRATARIPSFKDLSKTSTVPVNESVQRNTAPLSDITNVNIRWGVLTPFEEAFKFAARAKKICREYKKQGTCSKREFCPWAHMHQADLRESIGQYPDITCSDCQGKGHRTMNFLLCPKNDIRGNPSTTNCKYVNTYVAGITDQQGEARTSNYPTDMDHALPARPPPAESKSGDQEANALTIYAFATMFSDVDQDQSNSNSPAKATAPEEAPTGESPESSGDNKNQGARWKKRTRKRKRKRSNNPNLISLIRQVVSSIMYARRIEL